MKSDKEAIMDPERLKALHDLKILDTASEENFDRVSRLAARLLDVPVSVLTLVDEKRQFFKSAVGLTGSVAKKRQTPLSRSFCKYVVTTGKPLIVENAKDHPIVCDNPATLDGTVASYLGCPIRDTNGFILGSFCVMDQKPRIWTEADIRLLGDLSELVMTEIKLRQRNITLQQTNSLSEQLADTANAATRAKAAFLANMSHEIRTPMNAVIGMTELLQNSPLSADQQEYVSIIRESGESLLALINDILDFSKIESGHLEFETLAVPLVDCFKKAIDLCHSEAVRKNLEIRLLASSRVPSHVMGDPIRLRQILINLISNAVKFTEKGTILVTVDVVGSEGDRLRVSVQDQGIGISPDRMDRLFQAFTQADASISRKFGGTGLGLAICERLVGMMQGKIWVESELGKGSTFHFEIPLHPCTENGPASASQNATTTAEPANHTGGNALRILLAEDNPVNQRVATLLLRKIGYDCEIVSNGREALEELAKTRYDAVFLDIQMPVMDGFETARQIHERFDTQSRPWLIAMTALAMQGDREECLAAGMDDYISKPITSAALQAALARAVDKSSHARNA